ncbi:Phospho-N-acetylmuramoyl-pentapeptide-transferase [Lachnospiraceae bacterium XBB2008]|nr:Phospho-N-acetylmuramoyl-pentapeptide-transferase [Lachnospiraceae bacterium XBB2008]
MNLRIFTAAILSFAISALLGPVFIPFLHKIKFGQTVRDDGPESHLKKTGTPTMGGVIFLVGMLIPALLQLKESDKVLPILILTFGMALIGFVDDYVKVVLKRAMGLKAWQKLSLQIVLSVAFGLYLKYFTDADLTMKIPFMPGQTLDLGWAAIPFMIFVVIATSNGTNLTDGLDGLASTVTLVVSVFFCIASVMTGAGVEGLAAAFGAGLAGFLLFNAYPAKVFMGDTGSLALGGYVAGMAYALHMPLIIVVVGIIYVIETVSVILQVGCFKITHGKRIFKMAPIHHHFELCGWSETRVVTVFSIVTALFCILALVGIW